ncbi:probable Protein phosphatase 2C homolog 1 [Saccharomycodes ludwigii]|uniref:Probable Protein phosphatase 2C homolog 1 n=1 Tax=Saccharomycodes ludwigii TaxID=36035 RepID=A0A376B7N3_9ASCO|nr:hypothetical protein SCDLUD_002562 [Saccharomycodes ludwigii]KAH3901087.1 hypothetical protein SCDLUD_002562 [Saccharomycodes ludwigii]SSD60678.1 probable Protein phosphatase 2C homolog 1 [Saccharomycodes ludwigii]
MTDTDTANAGDQYELTYKVGVAENKNFKFRKTMEDVHTYVENFASRLDWGYFAIFDGHAGSQASKWCGSNLHSIIESEMIKGKDESGEESSKNTNTDNVRVILNRSFMKADKHICESLPGNSGCTAAVCVLRWEIPKSNDTKTDNTNASTLSNNTLYQHKRMLYTANVGDTRIVLFRNGKAIRLTYDHKASDYYEMKRVEQAGGLIMKSRVNGMLAVTRSLGDKFFDSLVIGQPFTTSVELTSKDQFLIIACDGLWDIISDQKACELIKNIKADNADLAANTLVKYALANGTTDNITVMCVYFSTYDADD